MWETSTDRLPLTRARSETEATTWAHAWPGIELTNLQFAEPCPAHWATLVPFSAGRLSSGFVRARNTMGRKPAHPPETLPQPRWAWSCGWVEPLRLGCWARTLLCNNQWHLLGALHWDHLSGGTQDWDKAADAILHLRDCSVFTFTKDGKAWRILHEARGREFRR